MNNNRNRSAPEHELIGSLGISLNASTGGDAVDDNDDDDYEDMASSKLNADASTTNNDDSAPDLGAETGYEVVPDPNADAVDLSGIPKTGVDDNNNNNNNNNDPVNSDDELDALEELVPDVKNRRRSNDKSTSNNNSSSNNNNPTTVSGDGEEVEVEATPAEGKGNNETPAEAFAKRLSMQSASSTRNHNITTSKSPDLERVDSMRVQRSNDFDDQAIKPSASGGQGDLPSPVREGSHEEYNAEDEASTDDDDDDDDPLADSDMYDGLDGNDSDNAIGAAAAAQDPKSPALLDEGDTKIPKEFLNNMSSAQSLSTATQTHEVRMPMYLPTFKPATGCTNASDFIVRCFVARLRSGITVVKHGRSRWCKSRLRILHIHPDGCSLSWKPAEGEPTSNRRPPKLDLTQCLEVRHAWSPDPQNPMYTGTPILRQKCEAANAHKSFALIFPKRTVDITAVTADQCKVLMEGFSALCFRLQVADLAGKGANNNKNKANGRSMPEEDGVSTTASVTLTNSSTPRAR
jgi:hypothetical protein